MARLAHSTDPLVDLRSGSSGVLAATPLGLALGLRLRILRRAQPSRLERHEYFGRGLGRWPLATRRIQRPRCDPLVGPAFALAPCIERGGRPTGAAADVPQRISIVVW